MKHPQFTLDLVRPADTSPSAFARAPANEAAMRLVEQWPDWPAPVVCIAGPAHAGKSHLAVIWAERAGAKAVHLADLSIAQIEGGLARPLWVNRTGDEAFDEGALLHAVNMTREEGSTMLLTARKAPSKWKVALPDLASRLNAVPIAEIGPPDEVLIEAILTKRLTDLGVEAEPATLRFLLARMERSYRAVHLVAGALGRRTLAAQQRATVPIAAEVLEEIGNLE